MSIIVVAAIAFTWSVVEQYYYLLTATFLCLLTFLLVIYRDLRTLSQLRDLDCSMIPGEHFWSSAGWQLAQLICSLREDKQLLAWELEAMVSTQGGVLHDRTFSELIGAQAGWSKGYFCRVQSYVLARFRATNCAVIYEVNGEKQIASHQPLPKRLVGYLLTHIGAQGVQQSLPEHGGILPFFGVERSLVKEFRERGSAIHRQGWLWLGYGANRVPTRLEEQWLEELTERIERDLLLASRSNLTDMAFTSAANKEDLIAAFAHDLRTPLANIRAVANLLQIEKLPNSARALPQMLNINCICLEELAEGILDKQLLERDQLKTRPESFDLARLVQESVFAFQGTAQSKGLSLRYESQRTEVTVMADRSQVRRALSNLISNAIKYTSKGEVVVLVELSGRSQAPCVVIKDSGVGLSRSDIERLFTPLTRLNPQLANGRGLGLAVTKRLIERNGGRLDVESVPGFGSSFSVVF